jgi:sortase (surface protein transpeptidase)
MADCDGESRLVAWRRLMGFLTDILRSRVLPAIVAAVGVSFIAAGLLTYTTGTDADLFPFPGDGIAIASPGDSAEPGASSPGASPTASAILEPSGSPGVVVLPTPIPSATGSIDVLPSPLTTPVPGTSASTGASAKPAGSGAPPSGPTVTAKPKPTPTQSANPSVNRVATRVVVPALDIDLPIVRPPGGSTTYPLCNVAMYIQSLSQPGYSGATYLYAHARVGMFLPLLDQSKINNGRAMLGMLVQVYTSDNMYFLYQITDVRRHQLTLADAVAAQDQELWLQTSEGPHGTPGKLQIVAMPISSGPASPNDANPTPHPVVCG